MCGCVAAAWCEGNDLGGARSRWWTSMFCVSWINGKDEEWLIIEQLCQSNGLGHLVDL
jgi:hypothetical protein